MDLRVVLRVLQLQGQSMPVFSEAAGLSSTSGGPVRGCLRHVG